MISKHVEDVVHTRITPKTNEGEMTTKERKQKLSLLQATRLVNLT